MTIIASYEDDIAYEIKYGNDTIDIMFDSSGEETLNPCDCVEYVNDYGEMIKVCFTKQFHIAFI